MVEEFNSDAKIVEEYDSDTMDALFKEAIEAFEECRHRLDIIQGRKQRVGGVRPPARAAPGNSVRDLVSQGEGSCKVRVYRGVIHQITLVFFTHCTHRCTSGYPGQNESCPLLHLRCNILEGHTLKDTPITSPVP